VGPGQRPAAELASVRCQPRKMSLDACIRRWPATTRWPSFVYLLVPTKRLSTDGAASFTCRNSGSLSLRPSISTIQQRVPTLPTPTTLRAMAANSNCSSRNRRSVSSVRRYFAIRLVSSDSMNFLSDCGASNSSIGTSCLPVPGDHGCHDRAALFADKPVGSPRDLQAGGEPLDVPLPRAGQRLVKVIDIEDQQPVSRAEDAEIGQVGVTARLHRQPGHRSLRQVTGHRQGRPPEVAERGSHHPAVPDGHELGNPRHLLLFQQGDGVRPVSRRVEHRMALPRHLGPGRLAPSGALGQGQVSQPRITDACGAAPPRPS
jgi:hypothetical protein